MRTKTTFGRSLLPVIRGDTNEHRDFVFAIAVRRRGLQGLLGGIGAWLIVAIAVRMLNRELASFGGLFGLSPSLGQMTAQQVAALLALAALLGWLGAWLSVSRHLWRMEPR